MKCPNCGEDVGISDAPFCPHCGQNLETRKLRRKLRFILMDVQDDRRFRHLASTAVIIVVISSILAVLLADTGLGEEPGPTELGPTEDEIIRISSTAYIQLGDGFDDGTFKATLEPFGELRIDLNSQASAGYNTFTWILRNDVDGTYLFTTKETASTNWIFPTIGKYTVTVTCSSTESDDTDVYVAKMVYYGDSHIQHTFSFEGRTYTVYSDVTLDSYIACSSEYSPGRYSYTPSDAHSFIVTDEAVSLLGTRLGDAFLKAYPYGDTSGAEFASFVLAFVQSCFDVEEDSALHSKPTYWAYPAETLYNGSGDSGDLAVLAASILQSCGFDATVAVMHGETFLATYIPDFSVPSGTHSIKIQSSGKGYYLSDVTGDSPLGSAPDEHDYKNGRFYYFGQEVTGTFGLAKT